MANETVDKEDVIETQNEGLKDKEDVLEDEHKVIEHKEDVVEDEVKGDERLDREVLDKLDNLISIVEEQGKTISNLKNNMSQFVDAGYTIREDINDDVIITPNGDEKDDFVAIEDMDFNL